MSAQQIDIRITGMTPEDHRNIGAKAIVATEPLIDGIVTALEALGVTVTAHSCDVIKPRKPKEAAAPHAPAAASNGADASHHKAGAAD